MLLIFSAGVAVFVIALFTILDQWSRLSTRSKLDELDAKLQKLKRYAQYQKRKALRDSIAMLKPKEREHLYSLWEDNAVVSRKTLFRLNELEDRLRRSERGAELRWAEARIREIRDAEMKLFPEAFAENGSGRRKRRK